MEKRYLILAGESNSGKTHTLNYLAETIISELKLEKSSKVYHRLEKDYLSYLETFTYKKAELYNTNCLYLISNKDLLIGICTYGDDYDDLEKKINDIFITKNANLIICASHASIMSDKLKKLLCSKGYKGNFIYKNKETGKTTDEYNEIAKKYAEELYKFLINNNSTKSYFI